MVFFQAEDGIRDAQESRGLGDVYKRQTPTSTAATPVRIISSVALKPTVLPTTTGMRMSLKLSLIHI